MSPKPGDTVTAALRFNTRYGPAPATASLSLIRPDGKLLWAELARTTSDLLTGSFFVDRSGSWHISSRWLPNGITLEVPGDGRILAPPPQPREERLPLGLIVGLALMPYPFAVVIWLALRRASRRKATSALPAPARIPRASYA